MVYVEYNLTKKTKYNKNINFSFSDSHDGYKYIQMTNSKNKYPSNVFVPNYNKFLSEESDVLEFIANQNYGNGKYYFNYNNQCVLFEHKLVKGDKLTFGLDDGNEYYLNIQGDYQNKKILPIYETLELNKNGNETTFSNIKVDFGSSTKEELPLAFQEIRIWQGKVNVQEDLNNCNLLYTGFLDNVKPTQKYTSKDECDLELSLLSPMNLTTKRTVSISGTYKTTELFNYIFEPLINDGFFLKRVLIDEKDVNVSYFVETVETVMNDLSNKLNFFWLVDENKNIYIIDINKLFGQNSVLTIDEIEKIEGLYSIIPTIENSDYFNCVNLKNARIYCTGYSGYQEVINTFPLVEKLKWQKDEDIEFVDPIDLGTNGLARICKNEQKSNLSVLDIKYGSDLGNLDNIYIEYSLEDNKIYMPDGVVFDDDDTENATVILKRDSFFKNLITGLKWKNASASISSIYTDSLFKYQIFSVTYSNVILRCSEFLSDSGIIDTVVDANESWYTTEEAVEYCNNLISSNSKETTSVELSFDKNYNIKIGDILQINMNNFFIDGKFIVTEIKESFKGVSEDYTITAINNKLTANYIDIFRKKTKEEEESKYKNINLVEYVVEGIQETHEVMTDED